MKAISYKDFNCAVLSTVVVRRNMFGGAIVRINLANIPQKKLILFIVHLLPKLFTKEIYFWVPYKSRVNPENYGNFGPPSRAPYAKVWFQVKETNILYALGTKNFESLSLKDAHDYVKANINLSFNTSDLIKVTSKPLIKFLDNIIFSTNKSKKHV